MSDRITLSSPGDVVAAIPALLGFHPARSLVALWSDHPSGTLVCTVRLDLDTPEVEMTRRLLDLSARTGCSSTVLVAYPDTLTAWVDSAEEAQVLAVGDHLGTAGVTVHDLLVVADDRYYSLMCTDPTCCPPLGRPVPSATTVLEAERVATGCWGVAASRGAVAGRYALRPEQSPEPRVLIDASYAVPTTLRESCALALAHHAALSTDCASPAVVAELMWLLQDVTVRDWVLAQIPLDPPDRARVDALVRIALTAPEDLRPRLAGAAAAALAAAGDDPVGVWSMLEHAGTDSLATLIAAGIDTCIPPSVLRDVLRDAATEIATTLAAEPNPAT